MRKPSGVVLVRMLLVLVIAAIFSGLAAYWGDLVADLRGENELLQARVLELEDQEGQLNELKEELIMCQEANVRLYDRLREYETLAPIGYWVRSNPERIKEPKAVEPNGALPKELIDQLGEDHTGLHEQVQMGQLQIWHVVKEGDWLSKLATTYWGDMNMWPVIWGLNYDKIKDPDLIYPGQVLRVR